MCNLGPFLTLTDCYFLRKKKMRLPQCDFCRDSGVTIPAEYDGRTVFGPCAYMCLSHFERFGQGLGYATGKRIPREQLTITVSA